jgi:hypothetical protein
MEPCEYFHLLAMPLGLQDARVESGWIVIIEHTIIPIISPSDTRPRLIFHWSMPLAHFASYVLHVTTLVFHRYRNTSSLLVIDARLTLVYFRHISIRIILSRRAFIHC